jgi:hypothetical protein
LQDEFVFTLDELARCIGDGSPAPPSNSERASSPSSSGYDLVDDMINIPVTSDADLPRAVDSEDDPFPKRRVSSISTVDAPGTGRSRAHYSAHPFAPF